MAKENQWTGLERPEDEGGEEKLDIGRVFPEKSDSTTMRQLLREKKRIKITSAARLAVLWLQLIRN